MVAATDGGISPIQPPIQANYLDTGESVSVFSSLEELDRVLQEPTVDGHYHERIPTIGAQHNLVIILL